MILIPLGLCPAFSQGYLDVPKKKSSAVDTTATGKNKVTGRAFLLGGLNPGVADTIKFDWYYKASESVDLDSIQINFFHDVLNNDAHHVDGQVLCVFNPSMGVELNIGTQDTVRVLFAPDCMEMGRWSDRQGKPTILRQLINKPTVDRILALKKRLFSVGSSDIFMEMENAESTALLLSEHKEIRPNKLKN